MDFASSTAPERDFHHPYEPYDIQRQFMNAVFDCIENERVGIFESPTGTGKSLSLICGSLTWLRDHQRREFEDGFTEDTLDESGEPLWMLKHAHNRKRQAAMDRRKALDDRIARVKEKERRVKEQFTMGEPHQKRRKIDPHGPRDESGDNEAGFVLEDYDSDEGKDSGHSKVFFNSGGYSVETQTLMEELGYASRANKNSDDQDTDDQLKIFYCSRTHSQLTQFASELRKVQMPSPAGVPDGPHASDLNPLVEDVKHLTLGSRKNLCINPKVNRLGNATAINERCLELQQPGTSTNTKCPHLPSKETEALVNDFRDHALARIRDIEELGSLGKKLGICPYYASRPATKSCEVVTLPYPLLLQKSARESLDISLKGHVIIVDEAHNLMDAINGIYSASVTLSQVQEARAQLTIYLQKFRNKLKGKNRVYVAQIIRLLDSIVAYLHSRQNKSPHGDGKVDMGALMAGKGVDQINLFKLNRYLQESRLARKVDGYTSYADQNERKNQISSSENKPLQSPKTSVPVLTHVQGFLLSLMNPSSEGQFFFSHDDDLGTELKYLLLDPTFHFKDIVEQARAVILAGGTMSPMSDYRQHLLSYLDPARIMTLSCGHIVPPSNLEAIAVSRSMSGVELEFTFEKRNSEKTMIDLGNTIVSVARHIPDGVVVFFPSYSYLNTCIAAWKRLRPSDSASSPSFWDALLEIKPIFMEQSLQQTPHTHSKTKDKAGDSVLHAYSKAVSEGQGALLFAVIGGNLSEGINFSDALGRGVVVVGLPFPNPHSAEWKAKAQYISHKATNDGQDGKVAARDFYENVCMRSVNQCIGRAIRHRGDYAAILMLDRRYSGDRIQAKLPQWIRKSLVTDAAVQGLGRRLDEFFVGKKAS